MSDLIERLRYATIDKDTPKLLTKAADEIERLNKCLRWEQNRAERIGTHGTDCFMWGHNHYECALKEIERLQRKAEILLAVKTEELAALKAQSTEPVAWRTFDGEGGYDLRNYTDNENYKEWYATYNPKYPHWCEPLYLAPPTATALVEDFKRRAVEVCKQHNRVITCITVVQRIQNEIESMPLIGEK